MNRNDYTDLLVDLERAGDDISGLVEIKDQLDHQLMVHIADLREVKQALREAKRGEAALRRAIWREDQKMELRELRRKIAQRLPALPKVQVTITR